MNDNTAKDQLKLDVNEQKESHDGPVESLGMTFPNDEARRKYFLDILREKLKDPEFRKIEGFPIGSDEDILALSDPPYYTACPNPFLKDFVRTYGEPYDADRQYQREPFAADVSEGKNDPIYNAHSYHTKVPHKAIMRYILHYTDPGDLVLDGFCGTGMTGVAAQLCGDRDSVQSLGYRVDSSGQIHDEAKQAVSQLGARKALLNDLSPVATFVAYNYNTAIDNGDFKNEAMRILEKAEAECSWMYETIHPDGQTKGRINYIVWSDVFLCPHCSKEVVFWDVAVDKMRGEIRDDFLCPYCGLLLTKRRMQRVWATLFDSALEKPVRQAKQVPVLINYSIGTRRYEKRPDDFDLGLITRVNESPVPYWFPANALPFGYNTEQPKGSHGLTHVHHFYSKRNLWTLALLLDKIRKSEMSRALKYQPDSLIVRQSKLTRFLPSYYFNGGGGWVGTPLTGVLYVPSFSIEVQPFETWKNRIPKTLARIKEVCKGYIGSTQSSGAEIAAENSVDYVFVDPPFGGNLMYSELNFIWESWLRVFTNCSPEAIKNEAQGKGIVEYERLMRQCFEQFYRALKPGRWMTVEFHNSSNSIWTAIQEALQQSGFVIADVRILDKKQGSFKQITSASTVKQDLIISAYKPTEYLEKQFQLVAGSESGVWEFIRAHMAKLPVFVKKGETVEFIEERRDYMLFDRMIGFHVRRGISVPISAAEFYHGLAKRFPERDGMFFLTDQLPEYERKRATAKDVESSGLFINDEVSAIRWVREQLRLRPQSFQDLQPEFMRQVRIWADYEIQMDLQKVLQENFLRYDGVEEVPSQIHAYLSTNFKDLRNLAKDDPCLCTKAKDRWYVPDPNKQIDLEKMRVKTLMREFEEYKQSTARKLKMFRSEAVRAGFSVAFEAHDYQTIVNVAKKLPQDVLDEDSTLRMFYDMACARLEE